MGSGNRRIIINTRERAISSDINRAESLVVADGHEFNRWRVNRDIVGDFYNFPGLQHAYTALPASNQFLVPHDCISGLMVDPTNAAGLLIDAGEAAFFVAAFPNAGADDSVYIQVSDAGVSSLATLPFVANGGPGIRWDIVECQPVENLLESASRDIYNTTTGQFTSSVVEKVRGGALTYRIRQGTPGNGIPDIDSAWMPLAAIHVRTDATGFHQCDVYDIRPLVNERCETSPNHPLVPPATASNNAGYRLVMDECEFGLKADAGINGHALTGYWKSHFGGFLSGGQIRCNTVSTSSATFGGTAVGEASYGFFNPQATINQSSGYTPAAASWFTIGAFFPRGYPRWVRYSQAVVNASSGNHLRITGRRIPQGPRGVLMVVFEQVNPNGIIRQKAMPTAFGETQNAWGHAVCEGYTHGASDYYPAEGGSYDRKFIHSQLMITPGSGATPAAATNICGGSTLVASAAAISTATLTTVDFNIARVYPVPPYARAVLMSFGISMEFAAPGTVYFDRAMMLNRNSIVTGPGKVIEFPGGQSPTDPTFSDFFSWSGTFWLPLNPSEASFDDGNALSANYLSLVFSHTGTGAPSGAVGIVPKILGYQL